MLDRLAKLFDAIMDIILILPKVLQDLYKGVTGLYTAFKVGDFQGFVNAAVRLVAIVETTMIQLTKFVTDLLDMARKR